MTTYIAKAVGKKIFKEHSGNLFGSNDPMYEVVQETDRRGRPTGRTTRRKKEVPANLSKNDQKILNKVRRRAHRLDKSFNFCGIKFGLGAIFGLFPVAGDFFDAFLAFLVIQTCDKIDGKLDPRIKAKMYLNLVIDICIGIVPVLGDVLDALYKCNTMNVALLEQQLIKRYGDPADTELAIAHGTNGNQHVNGVVVDEEPASVNTMKYPHDGNDHELGIPPRYETAVNGYNNGQRTDLARPEPAQVNKEKGKGSGWFSRLVGSQDQTDVKSSVGAPPQPPTPIA